MIGNVQQKYLWGLAEKYFFDEDANGARQIASDLVSKNTFASTEFETDIIEMSLDANDATARAFSVKCLRTGVFPAGQHAELVAILLYKSLLSEREAYELLKDSQFALSMCDQERLKKLSDVVWLLTEDEKRGVPATSDSLLEEVLLSIAKAR